MEPLWRRAVAVLTVASLLLSHVPAVSWAEPPAPVSPAEAMAFFSRHRVITGPDDVFKTYLGDDRRLTPLGEALFRSLRARYNPGEAVEAMAPSFDRLRRAGPYGDAQRQTVERAVAQFERRFADVIARGEDGTLEGSYQWGARVEAYMTGLAGSEAQRAPDSYNQVALPDGSGFEFWDAQGLAYRMNAQRVLTYNRALQQQQRLMNQDRPRQVRFIPETGRYNVEMLEYQYWRLKNQYDDIAKALRIDRLVLLSGLLHRQIREERYYLDTDAVERELTEAARGQTRVHRGRSWSILELADRRLRHRRFYLEGADRAVIRFQETMNLIKNGPTITDQQVQTLGLDERNALRWLSLSVLSTQEYAIRNQMDSLDPSSPDSQMLNEALGSAPFDARTRMAYTEQGERLRRRLETLQGLLANVRSQLLGSDYSGNLDLIQAGLSSAQRELTEIGTDYSLYVDVPSGAFLSAAESGQSWRNGQLGQPFGEGWTFGNWGVKLWGNVNSALGTRHGRNYERVTNQLPQYNAMAEMIARGDMAGARRAAIAMNPDAAARFAEVRLSGGDTRITDPVRIAASLRSNRMEIADVQRHNRWARTAASFITWTVGLALTGPLVSGTLGVTLRITEAATAFVNASRLGVAAPGLTRLLTLPLRAVSETARHVQARLITLNPARSQIPASVQNNLVGRYLYSSGVRFVNAAGRQASFTALSGVISTGFTVGTHLYDGSSSQFASTGDAALEGLAGGVVWANDSFHPALGYIGLPSSTFEGIRYVSPAATSFAARGLMGNVVAAADAGLVRVAGRPMLGRVFNLEGIASGQWAIRLAGQNMVGRGLQITSQAAGFTMAMVDQVAKYALFSKGVSIVAREVSYANGLEASALRPTALESGEGGDELRIDREGMELERRIKRSNASAMAWEASPVWLAIPTFPAHQALAGAVHQRGAEGMRQYDKAGRIHEYANAYEGQELPLISGRPKAPLAQRIFDWSWRTQESSDVWIVTKEARSEGIRKALNQEVGAVEGNLRGVNPMRFYEIMEMRDNTRLRNKLAVNDEVRELARKNLAETLVANPELTRAILDAKLGSTVEGFGVVRFNTRREIAATLHVADAVLGVKVPKDILGRLGPAHERYVQSDRMPKQPAREAIDALRALGRSSPGLDKFADHVADTVSAWREGPGAKGQHYTELIGQWRQEMRGRVERGELTAREANAAGKFFDTIMAIEGRFNSFNNGATVRATARDVIDAIKTEFAGGTRGAREVISRMERAFGEYKPGEGRVAGETGFKNMVSQMETALREARGLTATEAMVLKEAVSEVKNSPWAVRDKGGNPLPGWRPEQFESLMTALAMVMKQGHGGGAIRLFQMLKTGGGKTMLTYEGLLPFAEADAAARKMEVAFLTVQSNLEAQARSDYFAYKKLDSRLTFDTYEGLKTKIAEGKTQGTKALHKYWILGDEMDGAALQPALTIGEVTGRISRRSSVANRIDELDLSLLNRLENAMQGRANKALTEARNAAAEARRLDLPDISRAKAAVDELLRAADQAASSRGENAARARQALREAGARLLELPGGERYREAVLRLERTAEESRIATGPDANTADVALRRAGKHLQEMADPVGSASARLLRAAEDLQGARGPEAQLRAELGLRDAARSLRSLTENVPASQAESGLAMRRALGELERTLAEPPGRSVADPTLVSDMQAAFRRQRNLLELAGSSEGLQRLMVEARRLRMSGEQSIARLEREIVRARESNRPGSAETVRALEGELTLVRAETELAARFEGVDAGARVVSLSERVVALETQVAAGEGGPKAQAKLASVRAEISRLEQGMTPEVRQAHEQHRAAIREVHATGREMGRLDGQIIQARAESKPVEGLQRQLSALETQRSTQRARVTEKAAELSSGAADGAFGPGLQRLRIVDGKLTEVRARAESARASGRPDGALEAEVSRLAREKRGLERDASRTARRMFAEAADDILKNVREGQTGFEGRARRLIEQRRRLLDSFGGDESPIYRVYREMKDSMEPIANNKQLLHEDPKVHNRAADLLLKRIEGGSLLGNLWSVGKMTFEVFTGRPITVPIDRVGYTRIYAAKLLKGLISDPIMPPGQRENLFWTIAPSLLFPNGITGKGTSWVRGELLKLVQAFHENPAGIRFDGITKRVNVVHNGQWFESMDNESRRFWELEYGTDLTLPYTHRSISTIRDLTTDKRANFISFSGTAGTKFRGHLEANEVRLAGKGSVAPEGVRMDLRAGQSEKIAAIREAILQSAGLSREHFVVRIDEVKPRAREANGNLPPEPAARPGEVRLTDAIRAELHNHLTSRNGGKDGVVRIDQFSPDTVAWLRQQRALQPESTNLVVLSVSDTRVLKLVRNYMIRSGLVREREIAMVFSDAEFLRLNRPDARVHEQMNLDGLNNGGVRVLILDTRVGGRGLDLNYKGDRSPTAVNPFRGYTNYRMLIIDPHEMSAVHLLQAQGRIDLGRVLPGAHREFSLVMDVRAVQGEAMFRQMFAESPFFLEMRKDPALEAYARQRGISTIDWATVHDFMLARELTGTPEAQALTQKYRAEVQQYLERRQLEVEEDQLRSSSVSDEPSTSPGRHPGLLRFTPGR
jgi:hypothetical protein